MPKRTITTSDDGSVSTKVELYTCEKLQLEKGDQQANKAWLNNDKTKAVKAPKTEKGKNNEIK